MINFIIGLFTAFIIIVIWDILYTRRNRDKWEKVIDEERKNIMGIGYRKGVADMAEAYKNALNKIETGNSLPGIDSKEVISSKPLIVREDETRSQSEERKYNGG